MQQSGGRLNERMARVAYSSEAVHGGDILKASVGDDTLSQSVLML
jgi:hypothetical protein